MLQQLVKEFTKTHESTLYDNDTGETQKVEHQAYWQQLTDMVNYGGGKPAAGNSNPSRILVNADALELRNNITRKVNEQWPGAGRQHLLRKPVPDKIRLWAAHAADNQDAEKHLADQLTRWINQIEALDNPVDTIFPPCPECERDHIWITVSTGRRQHQALQSNGKAVWCNACETRWEGIPGMKLLAKVLDQAAA